jgi:hypothetical protein
MQSYINESKWQFPAGVQALADRVEEQLTKRVRGRHMIRLCIRYDSEFSSLNRMNADVVYTVTILPTYTFAFAQHF